MKKFFLSILITLTIPCVVAAKASPQAIVASLGKEMSEWCKTGDISHREKLKHYVMVLKNAA